MNGYTLALGALVIALSAQIAAAGRGLECSLLAGQPRARRRAWMAQTIGSLLFALHHVGSLELILHTGLYDLRQTVLAALASICFAFAAYAFRRQA
ncbi:MAG: hypothetical protein FWC58_05510 [Desulfobulbus sp.]|nr:hypothetical protein [Desulfobulbus sp.]